MVLLEHTIWVTASQQEQRKKHEQTHQMTCYWSLFTFDTCLFFTDDIFDMTHTYVYFRTCYRSLFTYCILTGSTSNKIFIIHFFPHATELFLNMI